MLHAAAAKLSCLPESPFIKPPGLRPSDKAMANLTTRLDQTPDSAEVGGFSHSVSTIPGNSDFAPNAISMQRVQWLHVLCIDGKS